MSFEEKLRACGQAHAEFGAMLAECLCHLQGEGEFVKGPFRESDEVDKGQAAHLSERIGALEARLAETVLPACDELRSVFDAQSEDVARKMDGLTEAMSQSIGALSTRVSLLENKRR